MSQKSYKYTVPEAVIQTAHMVDLLAYIQARHGLECKLERNGKRWSCGEGFNKLSISQEPDGHFVWNRWYDHMGGDPIQYVIEYENKSWLDAVFQLYDYAGGKPVTLTAIAPQPAKQQEKKKRPEFRTPVANKDSCRAMAWLTKTRGIDPYVVIAFMREKLIYESAIHHNCVFLGTDPQGVPRHANLRGTSTGKQGRGFRINEDGSDGRYSFQWRGKGSDLYVFEAPVDLLSYITLHPANWPYNSYLALCGTSMEALSQALTDNPKIQTVHLCLDNDEAGKKGNNRLAAICQEMGRSWRIRIPVHKDWNDDLLALRKEGAI